MDACLELGGDGVLVHVGVVLVDALEDEPVALGLHPRGDERRQVQPRAAVQQQLVVDDLVRRVLGDGLLPQLVPARMPSPHEMKTPARCSQRMISIDRNSEGGGGGGVRPRERLLDVSRGEDDGRRGGGIVELLNVRQNHLSVVSSLRSGCLPGDKRLLLLFD